MEPFDKAEFISSQIARSPAQGVSPVVGFCVIGVQKAGTSALFHFLSQHPSVRVSTKKEVHFFDSEQNFSNIDPDYSKYHRFFPEPSGDVVMGEATPIYIFWPNAIERLAAYNPQLRLIAVFRDPIERAYAHWRMVWARGIEPLAFSQAIRQGRDRLRFPTDFSLRHWSYVERGFYGAQVRRLVSLFPRKQLFFLRTEDLRDSHVATVRSLFEFLQLAPVDVEREDIFSAAPPTSRDLMQPEDVDHLMGLYRDDLVNFADETGLDVSEWT
jgi:hypothetical protein